MFGTVSFEGSSIKLYDNGALINAIRNGVTLHIINAPDEAELRALLRRIQTERKIFFNGELEIVMRVYFEKPRTTVGWKGLINDLTSTKAIVLKKVYGLRAKCSWKSIV